MPCIEPSSRGLRVAGLALLLAACSSPMPPDRPRPAPAPTAPPRANAPSTVQPGPAARARNWDEFQRIAALRLVAANAQSVYTGDVPDPLLAIPVLEVELNSDGSVRQIQVLRQPTQARDTVQLAIDAVRRAAPFGDVSHLPRPWKFREVFLFDDARRFKPRTLDE